MMRVLAEKGMAERTIRFGVASKNRDRRSATWRCWTNLGRDNSVYLTCRELKGIVHLSLHETGQWHVAFAREKFDGLFENSSRPESRFSSQWLRPQETAPGWVLACRICIPWYGVTSPNTVNSKNIVWIDEPNKGQMCEVYIFLASSDTVCTNWPGAREMGTALVGSFDLANESQVWIVSREIPLAEPKLPPTTTPNFFSGVGSESLNSYTLRGIAWGTAKDGSIWFFDAPVRVERNSR